ncbi:hypothetical protein EYF80_010046 [Liparis tanakae]|uniref:Ig-like domain-containing protein n=1 Tax=Liparis tanakae TaxID=230148 RepID=A0A4Z2IR06_9TELE|nr:hypothetical protein EYF80_010046 [Liparis tanakae]
MSSSLCTYPSGGAARVSIPFSMVTMMLWLFIVMVPEKVSLAGGLVETVTGCALPCSPAGSGIKPEVSMASATPELPEIKAPLSSTRECDESSLTNLATYLIAIFVCQNDILHVRFAVLKLPGRAALWLASGDGCLKAPSSRCCRKTGNVLQLTCSIRPWLITVSWMTDDTTGMIQDLDRKTGKREMSFCLSRNSYTSTLTVLEGVEDEHMVMTCQQITQKSLKGPASTVTPFTLAKKAFKKMFNQVEELHRSVTKYVVLGYLFGYRWSQTPQLRRAESKKSINHGSEGVKRPPVALPFHYSLLHI